MPQGVSGLLRGASEGHKGVQGDLGGISIRLQGVSGNIGRFCGHLGGFRGSQRVPGGSMGSQERFSGVCRISGGVSEVPSGFKEGYRGTQEISELFWGV